MRLTRPRELSQFPDDKLTFVFTQATVGKFKRRKMLRHLSSKHVIQS